MFQLEKIIVESVQSHLDLNRFADYILDKTIKDIQKHYNENKRFADAHDFGKYNIRHFLNLVCIKYKELRHSKKYSKEFLKALKKSEYLCVQFDFQKESVLGEYNLNEKRIKLFFPSNLDITPVVEKNTETAWMIFLNNRESTLIHELQHWYDAIRSTTKSVEYDDNNKPLKDYEGNIIKQTRPRFNLTPTAKKYKDKYGHLDSPNDNESYTKYLKQHHEIVARFAQLASTIKLQRLRSVKEAIEYLKDEFVGWRDMPLNVQHYLMKKMTTLYYHYYPKDTPKIDIQPLIDKYIETKKQSGYSNLSIYTMGDILELQSVDGGKELRVIQDLIKIADIYRKNLIIHNDLLKNIPTETISQLGLRKNIGKHRDFRFNHDEHFRYPKRTEQISKKFNLKNNI